MKLLKAFQVVKREDLAYLLYRSYGFAHNLTTMECSQFISALGEAIKAEVAKGNAVELRGFAMFGMKNRKRGAARNMRTGERLNLSPIEIPCVVPSRMWNELVKDRAIIRERKQQEIMKSNHNKENNEE